MTRRIASFCIAGSVTTLLVLGLGACSSDETTSSTTTIFRGVSTVAGEYARVPNNVCLVIAPDDVAAIVGEPVVAVDAPPGGCRFNGASATSLSPTISIAEDFGGLDTMEAARLGAETLLGSSASNIEVDGVEGYVVTGQAAGVGSSQGGVATRGVLITVTVSGADPQGNIDAVTELLKLALKSL